MGRSLVIGRVHDIEIKIHPTFLLLLPWIVLNWGYLGGYGLAGVAFGAVLMLLLFTFVLLHELGHSVVALRYGVGVRDITLFPIGGVARIERLPTAPGREIAIALAGPAVNLAIALLFAPPILLLTHARGQTNPLELLAVITDQTAAGFIVYLFFTNVMLVLFNLLPAFPMDGGRVLRAFLSLFMGRLPATRVAVLLGQLFGLGLAVLGLLVPAPSLILVAVFIIVAAHSEGTAMRVEETLRTLRVGPFIVWDMGGVNEHHPLAYALRGGPRDVAVLNADGRVVGMLWRHELMQALNGAASRFRTAGELMDGEAIVADVDDTVYEVHRRMLASGRRALPVTEHGYYRGIFTSDRYWHIYSHLARRPWLELRARLQRLALSRRVRLSGR